MAVVPSLSVTGQCPQDYLNQILALISTLRGGEARFLPLVMMKIRETLPSISSKLPPALAAKMAAGNSMLDAASGRVGYTYMHAGNGMSPTADGGGLIKQETSAYIKQEMSSNSSGTMSAGVSEAGSMSPYMLYYPHP